MWCGVVWCGVVWCGVVWPGLAWPGLAWPGVAWTDSTLLNVPAHLPDAYLDEASRAMMQRLALVRLCLASRATRTSPRR